jgi:TonB-dependent receptor
VDVAVELSLTPNFEIDEEQIALYLQAEFEKEVGGGVFDGQVGVRYLTVDTNMTFTDVNSFEKPVPRRTVSPKCSRISCSATTLRRTGWFAEGSAVYGTWFKRDIEGFAVSFRNPVIFDLPDDDPDRGPYTFILSQPDNTSNGVLDGFEFGLVYFPTNLPRWLNGAGIQATYTMLDSEQGIPVTNEVGEITGTDILPIFGVSDTSYNVILAYDRYDFDMRLSYVWREDFLQRNEAALFANPLGIYRSPEESLDFQLSWAVNENFTLTFDATNLTEEIYHEYYEFPDIFNFSNSLFSRTFALGVRFQM